uniref:Uncharacterized protein n=1 Tax=Arundo donax TaxID=35708 RepID=A0A0A9HJ64_ARUDO
MFFISFMFAKWISGLAAAVASIITVTFS